jgi:hypothetical protein
MPVEATCRSKRIPAAVTSSCLARIAPPDKIAMIFSSHDSQTEKFIDSVDESTIEVSDYTVLVQGLPSDATAHEVRPNTQMTGWSCFLLL